MHTKYHHFKENLLTGKPKDDGPEDGIRLVYINTSDQIADLLTKGLGNSDFITLRDKLMGWVEESWVCVIAWYRNDGAREGDLRNTN